MAKNETYHVRLIRPRFEVSYLSVEAPDHETAEDLAQFLASNDPAEWKLIDFSLEDYHPFVERCLAENEVTADEAEAELSSTEIPERDKYLLLYADTFGGDGKLVEQPWLRSESALMKADLCGDWCMDLQAILENEASEDDIELELQGGEATEATKSLLAETLRKPPKPDKPRKAK